MRQSSPFIVRAARLPGDNAEWLVEVLCRPPTGAALAIVLDLSDSSGAMRDEATKLARLVRHLPRAMPMWLYRLSSHVPATYERHPIAHIQDGTIELSRLLEDTRTREFMSWRGSLFRPVLDSICERKAQERISEVRVIVLTDGELLDAAELAPPEGVSIVGITRSSSDAKCKHWRRVLPTCPIYDLQNPALDNSFEDMTTAFYGACDVSWNSDSGSRVTKTVSLESGQVQPLEGDALTWNFADGPMLLVCSAAHGELDRFRMTVRSLKNHQAIEIVVERDMVPLDNATVAAGDAILKAQGADQWHVLLDSRGGDSSFESAKADFQAGERLAEARAPWRSPEGDLQVWKDESNGGLGDVSHYDALLCIGVKSTGAGQLVRIIVFGLRQSGQPAFAVGEGPFLDIGKSPSAIAISFDRREARWMLQAGGAAQELDPRGSQRLDLPLVPGEGFSVMALFSGPLR